MLRGVQLEKGSYVYFPGGNFKDCLFSSLPGEMTLFDSYVSDGLKAPTSFCSFKNCELDTCMSGMCI